MANMEMDGGIKIYLREIGKTPLLTREEEFELADRIKKGDPEARAHMIKANLRLVVKIAQDYANYGLPLLDLISEGNMGLMKAVERFDPNKGGKLSTYAAWWIKQSIKRALANQSKTIRLPVHMVDKISKMRRVAMAMSEELGREPTDEELSEEIGIDRAKLSHLKTAAMRPASLDAPISDDGPESFGEIVGDEKAWNPSELASHKNMHMQLDDLLEVLDERERKVVDARFGLAGQKPKTLEEVGQEFGVTRERIRQLQNIALKKLNRAFAKKDDSRFIEDEDEEDSASSRRSRQFDDALEQGLIGASRVPSSKQIGYSPRTTKSKAVVRQPLGGGGRNDSGDLQAEMRAEFLQEKRKKTPMLKERESLTGLQRQVIDLLFGFNGTQFVVENGLNFFGIAERLHIRADEAKLAYEAALVSLERQRGVGSTGLASLSSVEEYRDKISHNGNSVKVHIENESPSNTQRTPAYVRHNSHSISPEGLGVTPWWKEKDTKKSPKNGSQRQTKKQPDISELLEETSLETGEIDAGMPVESGMNDTQIDTQAGNKQKEEAVEDKMRELLSDEEYRVMSARFGLDGVSKQTIGELAAGLDMSCSAIDAIMGDAFLKISKHFNIPVYILRQQWKSQGVADSTKREEQKAISSTKKVLPDPEKENLSKERKAEAEKVRAILHTLSGTNLAVAKKFWGEKEGDPVNSLPQIAEDLKMKSTGNVHYYITKIRKRLSPGPDVPRKSHTSYIAEEAILERESAYIESLDRGVGEWFVNKDFGHIYDISIEWLRQGKRASDLVHEEALIIGTDGSKHFDVLIRDTKYFSPHLQALLLRAYKKQYPSYRIPQEILEQFKK